MGGGNAGGGKAGDDKPETHNKWSWRFQRASAASKQDANGKVEAAGGRAAGGGVEGAGAVELTHESKARTSTAASGMRYNNPSWRSPSPPASNPQPQLGAIH